MWSFGCLLAEISINETLFNGGISFYKKLFYY